jgi:predicted metal-dependent hydrolase
MRVISIKLPYTLIDYLLVHTKEKNRSKAFWAELAKHMPQWRALDEQVYGLRV